MRNMTNRVHVEGALYQHTLEKKVTGPNSKKPGTEYIAGNIEIATDDAMTNIVVVHYSYTTALTSKGTESATYKILDGIINGQYGSVMAHGADKAVKLRVDTAFGLNEWYDQEGEFISRKRNEGGFIHVANSLNANEADRSTFDCDMVITNVRELEANEERGLAAKAIIGGYIFDFRKAILPVEFSATNENAIKYFLGLDASANTPVFTRVKGSQISTVIKQVKNEESAFGPASVQVTEYNRKDCVVTWAAKEPYDWDDEQTITAAELKSALADREVALATMKKNSDDYKANKNAANNAIGAAPAATATTAPGGFAF